MSASPGFLHPSFDRYRNAHRFFSYFFVAVGFCGSFTTLSALVMEMNTMMQQNEVAGASIYLISTMLGGFACFYVGAMLVRSLMQLQTG